jgi:hypothetical protein
MNHEIKALGELRAEFERVAALGVSRRRWVLPRWRPVGVTILVVLAGATGALAAAGLIHFGKPVGSATGKPPAASAGNGAVKPASVRLLAVHAQDPGGGLWWGMRFTTTTRALGCLEVGREQDGTIGVIGQDNAFHNDGAFHPLPAFLSATSPDCAPLDRQGRLILNESVGDVPASGLNASGLDVSGSCLPPNAHKPGGAFCPVRDERNLYYGLLGPQATRITYTAADGASHTLTPVGPDGAYLIVERAVERPGSIDNAMSGSLYPSLPITAITYRNGLRCSFTNAVVEPPRACRFPPGYAPAQTPRYTAAQLATPVDATIRPAGTGRWKLTVSFVARAPVTNALSNYGITLQLPNGLYGFTIGRDVRRGSRLTLRPWGALRLRPGAYHGIVRFATSTTPGQPPLPIGPSGANNIIVGRFTIHIPYAVATRLHR